MTSNIVELMNYIGGKWTESISGRTLEKINPTTGEVIAKFPDSDNEDAIKAIECAAECRDTRRLLNIDIEQMDSILSNICEEINSQKDELVECLVKETGKSDKEALGEVNKAIRTFQAIHYQKYNPLGEVLPSKNQKGLVFTTRCPVGVVVVITPWNFPVYIGAQHLAPAIMGRNSVIFKCSPNAPITSTKLIQTVLNAGLPKDMISLVHGIGEKVSKLVSDRRVDMVSFTGNSRTAKEIATKTGGKKFIFEGGGNNFQVVLSNSNIKLAAEKAVEGMIQLSGQKCVTTGCILIKDKKIGEFLEEATKVMKKIKVGDVSKGADIGPIIGKNRLEELEKLIGESEQKGAKVILGGHRIRPAGTNGLFFEPTIIITPKDLEIVKEELFAPILKIISIKDLSEAIEIINNQEYGLTASIFSDNNKLVLRFIKEVRVGMVNVNSHTGGSEAHIPFGGVRSSGNGFRLGNPEEAIRAFTEVKTIKWNM